MWQNMLLRYLLALLVAETAIALAVLLASLLEEWLATAFLCFLQLSFSRVLLTQPATETHPEI